MAESAFDKLANKIASRGYSKKSAAAIAATIGRRKYGKKGMAEKSAAGRAKMHPGPYSRAGKSDGAEKK